QQNPQTPGTRLLKQFPSTQVRNPSPNPNEDATHNYRWHYELWARQQGNGQPALRWSDNPADPNVVPSDWQPHPSGPPGQGDATGGHGGPTDPSANSAPWVSFNNPIGMQYVPGPGFNIGVGTALTYTNPDATDRYNGDNYQSWTDHTQDQASFPA